MRVDTVTTFFALLGVLGLVFLVAVAAIAATSALSGGLPPSLRPAREGLGQVSLVLAFLVALTCTLGSLYLSEVAKFPPCDLCWYQRILMYPQVILLGIAALRRDAGIRWYSVPMVLIGAGISVYHYLIERFPDSVKFSCEAENPCSTVWVWKFHFLSIPAMAGIGFLLIAVLVMLSGPFGGPGTGSTLGSDSTESDVTDSDATDSTALDSTATEHDAPHPDSAGTGPDETPTALEPTR